MDIKLPFSLRLNKESLFLEPLFHVGLLVLSLLPFVFFSMHYLREKKSYQRLEKEVKSLEVRAQTLKLSRKDKDAFFEKYLHFDRYFVEKEIEGMSFLNRESEMLEAITNHDAFAQNLEAKERLKFLTSGENCLQFAETYQEKSAQIEEVEMRSLKPVELNNQDLAHLLATIEGLEVGGYISSQNRPQLAIKTFELTQCGSLLLSLELIKRTPIHDE